jgi:DNA polymerase III subunit epsilon
MSTATASPVLKNITLTRPLAILDLETTGTDPKECRIVEVSILKLGPDGAQDMRTRRVNPGIPIPESATAIHGITDAMVANCPTFRALAAGLLSFLDGADLCGFNLRRFDLRVLANELKRCGMSLPLAGRHVVDPIRIYHERERRDLSAAVRLYLGREHDGAHGAEADVLATVAILDAQITHYGDLPGTIEELHALQVDPGALDFDGKLRRDEAGWTFFTFGKYEGKCVETLARDPRRADYLDWMLSGDFLDDTKDIVRGIRNAARAEME